MEGIQKQEQTNETAYDREAEEAKAEEELVLELQDIELDESVPTQFETAVKLEKFLEKIDVEEFDNSLRHIAKAAEIKLSEELEENMSQKQFKLFQQYKMQEKTASEAA